MPSAYTFCRGDTIALALQIVGGDGLAVQSLRASIRSSFGVIPSVTQPSANALVSYVPVSGSALAYWAIAIAPQDSFSLPSGDYILDAELVASGIRVTTAPALISIYEPSTPPATPVTNGYGNTWVNPSPDFSATSLSLQWADAMDNSASVFPALSLTIDPNIVALMEATLTPQPWSFGTTINFLTVPNVRIQVDGLSGLDSITFAGTMVSGGTTYNVPAEDENKVEHQSITSPGIYTVPGFAYLTPTHIGSAPTPTITYLPIYL